VTCRAQGLSKQVSYARKDNPLSRRDWDEAHLINTAVDIHPGDRRPGPVHVDELAQAGRRPVRTEWLLRVLSSRSGRCSPGRVDDELVKASPVWDGDHGAVTV
jgi:hypothetical protein